MLPIMMCTCAHDMEVLYILYYFIGKLILKDFIVIVSGKVIYHIVLCNLPNFDMLVDRI